MTRRRVSLLLAFSLLIVGAFWIYGQQALALKLERIHPVMVRAFPSAIAKSETGPGLLVALSALDAPERRPATRATLADFFKGEPPVETLDLGFGPQDTAPEWATSVTGRTVALPREAAALAATTEHLLLLLHVTRPSDFALPARQRGWIGPRLEEVALTASHLTVTVAESGVPARLRVTLALAYPEGADAERALRRLTEVQGDVGQLGFAAQPGYERIVRQTRLVVIRLDVEAALARTKLPKR